ncbi:MAG: Rieske (2Fe-2S) protein [Gemmatimonadota bacterium]
MNEPIHRREFVRRLPVLTAGLAACASTPVLTACAGAAYLTPVSGLDGFSIPAEAVRESGGVFIQNPDMRRPIYVHHSESGEWTAVLASCTHAGCQPEPLGNRLVCPCHGSEFSFAGEVLQGPAERALTRYRVVEEGRRLMIRIDGGAA